MANSPFDRHLLESKKNRFIYIVKRACAVRSLAIPFLNFDYCAEEHEDQLAHYHPDYNVICVSPRQLMKMNFDEIEHVAAHEVSHILEQNHSSAFYEEQANTNIGVFRPGGGVVIVSGTGSKPMSKKKLKPDKKRCNYNLCRKRTRLFRCKHCRNYFCATHKAPKPPCPPFVISKDPIRKSLIEASKEPNAHPCPNYLDYWILMKIKENREYAVLLGKLLGRKPIIPIYPSKDHAPVSSTASKSKESASEEQTIDLNKYVIALIVFILLVIAGMLSYPLILNLLSSVIK